MRITSPDALVSELVRLRQDIRRWRKWARRWSRPMGRAVDDGVNLRRVAEEAERALRGEEPPPTGKRS